MFNKNLKNIRLKQGISQKQVADYLNISPQSVSKWEKNEALPSIEYLPKLAEVLKCEINDFFVVDEETFDLEMLKEFFAYMVEHIYEETKKTEDFIPVLKRYPDILNVIKQLGESYLMYEIQNPETC